MNAPIFQLPDSDLSLRVALTLVHFVWQGLVLAGLAVLACGILRRAASRTRYRVLLAALLVMALCPFATFVTLK